MPVLTFAEAMLLSADVCVYDRCDTRQNHALVDLAQGVIEANDAVHIRVGGVALFEEGYTFGCTPTVRDSTRYHAL